MYGAMEHKYVVSPFSEKPGDELKGPILDVLKENRRVVSTATEDWVELVFCEEVLGNVHPLHVQGNRQDCRLEEGDWPVERGGGDKQKMGKNE